MEKLENKSKLFKEIFESAKSFTIALILAMLFRSVLYDPYHIPSGSMKPNLIEGDYIFVSKYAYGYSRYSFPFGINFFSGRIFEFNKPKPGDVIVFKVNGINYIKRLIGLPGDKVQVKNGVLFVNDVEFKRDKVGNYNDLVNPNSRFDKYKETNSNNVNYLVLDELGKNIMDNTQEYFVPKGHYFFMGDNRDNSADSRFRQGLSFIPEENIVGRAEIVFFSSSAKIFEVWKWPFSFKLDRFFINLKAS